MTLPPIVVAQLGAGFPVGVVRWKQHGSHRVTVLAKLTFAADGLTLAPEQEPLLGRIDDEVTDPGDHVPRKLGVDVLLRGSVRGPSGAERFVGSIAIPSARRREAPTGAWRRDLVFVASPTSPLVPLAGGHVLEADGVTPAGALGRVDPPPMPWREESLAGTFDFAACQCASSAQQLEGLPAGSVIELDGAMDFTGKGVVRLPAAPWIFLDRGFGDGEVLALTCDTLTLDLDTGTLGAVWRADFDVDEPSVVDLDRIVARWAPSTEESDVDELRSGIPRAHFVLAEELGREPDPAAAEVLHVARFEAMEVAAAPELDIRTYARISAELAEGRPPREQVLAKHGLTEEAWAVEERAHVQLLADRANYGDVENAVVFGDAFVAAQEELADPREADWTVEQHGLLTAQLESTRDVPTTLADHGLVLGAYLRIERRIAKLTETDADARIRFEKALDEGRLVHPEQDDELDDEGADDEEADGEDAK